MFEYVCISLKVEDVCTNKTSFCKSGRILLIAAVLT